MLHAPFGYALRAGRDSPLRADAIGIDVKRLQWVAFVVAGLFAGLAGALFAFSKGSISPETLGVGSSVDGLVMVLLGGLQTLAGPMVGAALFTWLQDTVARNTDYWRALLGASSWCWCSCSRRHRGLRTEVRLHRERQRRERRACSRSPTSASPSAASARSTASASRSRPANCWR